MLGSIKLDASKVYDILTFMADPHKTRSKNGILPAILIVEDDSHTLDAIERALQTDFQVLRAETPAQAIHILETTMNVAIILTDFELSGQDGLELLKNARIKSPESARAIISGKISLSDLVESINSGLVHRLILKPWDNDYLRIQMLESLQEHHLIQERNRLAQLSITDPLTQLNNFRFFQDTLQKEMHRATRHQRSLSLIMVDIDHFKNFNDQFGHPAGDKILIAVGRRILDQVRNLDVVARYGGEEFVVVLPDTGPEVALKVAERIRSSFLENSLTGPSGSTNLTISLGVASFPQHADSVASLISCADKALYQAKNNGRNQTVLALSPSC